MAEVAVTVMGDADVRRLLVIEESHVKPWDHEYRRAKNTVANLLLEMGEAPRDRNPAFVGVRFAFDRTDHSSWLVFCARREAVTGKPLIEDLAAAPATHEGVAYMLARKEGTDAHQE
jgi:hypothetical protein